MNPRIEQTEEKNGTLSFTLSGVNVSLANALRRTIISDIPALMISIKQSLQGIGQLQYNLAPLTFIPCFAELIKAFLSACPAVHKSNPSPDL